jgi:hypothetical protein
MELAKLRTKELSPAPPLPAMRTSPHLRGRARMKNDIGRRLPAFLRPLLTSRRDRKTSRLPQSLIRRPPEVSPTAFRAQPPGLRSAPLMDTDLRDHLPARPALTPHTRFLFHRLERLLHASFRPRLATTPLRFANPSPPSGRVGDSRPQAVGHARCTKKGGPSRARQKRVGGYVSCRTAPLRRI